MILASSLFFVLDCHLSQYFLGANLSKIYIYFPCSFLLSTYENILPAEDLRVHGTK